MTLKHTRIKVEENKRIAIFRNAARQNIRVTTVDGCLITQGPRADYMISQTKVASVLVELKGKNVEHACDQLFASATDAKVKAEAEAKIGFLVVCSKYPRFDTFVRKAKQKAARDFGSGFHVVCGKGEFDLAKLAAIDGTP